MVNAIIYPVQKCVKKLNILFSKNIQECIGLFQILYGSLTIIHCFYYYFRHEHFPPSVGSSEEPHSSALQGTLYVEDDRQDNLEVDSTNDAVPGPSR